MAHHHKRKVDNLSRLMRYILGTRPDEFGLVPDQDGFITLKELLRAINEEPNMGYVRESHIREVLLHDRNDAFEMNEKNIKSTHRAFTLTKLEPDIDPPKILYKGIKRKTYPFILKSGLLPGSKRHVALTKDKDLAIRIAHRLDQKPIILEIRAGAATENGIPFFSFGESLYLTDRVPIQFISGPPLPKQPAQKREVIAKEREITPGSFLLTEEKDPDLARRTKTRKRIEWKKGIKKRRKRTGNTKNKLHLPF